MVTKVEVLSHLLLVNPRRVLVLHRVNLVDILYKMSKVLEAPVKKRRIRRPSVASACLNPNSVTVIEADQCQNSEESRFNTLYIELLDTSNQNTRHTAYLDTFSDANFISQKVLATLDLSPTSNESTRFRLGDGSVIKPPERVNIRFRLFNLDRTTAYPGVFVEMFFILPETRSCSDVLLGVNFIEKHEIYAKTNRFAGFVVVQTAGDDVCSVSRELCITDAPATRVPSYI